MITLLASALITLSVNVGVCFEPCEPTVTLTVERAPDNHEVRLELIEAGDNYYRRSDLPYDGNKAKTVEIRFIAIPAGNYVFRAILFKHDGRTWIAGEDSIRLKVMGEGEI